MTKQAKAAGERALSQRTTFASSLYSRAHPKRQSAALGLDPLRNLGMQQGSEDEQAYWHEPGRDTQDGRQVVENALLSSIGLWANAASGNNNPLEGSF